MESKIRFGKWYDIGVQLNYDRICDPDYLIGNSIKFFLHQRGQIPVPFENLHDKIATDVQCKVGKNGIFEFSNENIGAVATEKQIKKVSALRAAAFERRKERILGKKLKQEYLARDAIQASLKMLNSCLSDFVEHGTGEFRKSFVILGFGSSLRALKEAVIFEVHSKSSNKLKHESFGASGTVMRQMFRQIILHPSFAEYTTKPLNITCSHICLLLPKLSGCSLPKNLIFHDNIDVLAILQKTRQTLKIKIYPDQLRTDYISDCTNDMKIPPNCHLYQLPLSLKGVKNRRN